MESAKEIVEEFIARSLDLRVCQRNYLSEAYEIARGESRLQPEKAHLKALVNELRRTQGRVI